MGFLLMSYEYQRATREYSMHQAAEIRYNNEAERASKRVKNMESVFEKAKSKVDSKYTNLSSQASNTISQAMSMSTTVAQFNAAMMSIVIGGVCLGAFVQAPTTIPSGSNLLTVLSTYGAQAKTVLNQLIEAAKEQEKEKVEEQENNMLEPIREKESDMTANQQLENTLCEVWKTRKDNAEKRLGEDIKDSVGKFGLS